VFSSGITVGKMRGYDGDLWCYMLGRSLGYRVLFCYILIRSGLCLSADSTES
jgi:hypothetical protein